MKKDQKSILVLLVIFVLLLSTTLFVSFSSNVEVQEVVVKSITPVYDENSTVVVDSNNVVFNDKNQVVDYKVVIENTQNYDVKITDITLSTPTEEFLQYTLKDISKDDILVANSTKELTISLETMGIEGWGRNFADELTANISFERVSKQEETPKEEEKEEDKQPEPPAPTIKEVIKQTEKIEPTKVTKDVIEFKEEVKVEVGDKIAVWIYSEPIFLGYFDVVETNGVKQIVGLEEALKKADIEVGEHNIVLETEDKEVVGYVEIYINEEKELSSEKPQDTNKEEIPKEEDKPVIENKPSTDNKDESEEDGKVENPYTSDKGLLVVLVIATGITGLAIIVVSKNKFAKYTIFIIALSSSLTLVNAEEPSDLPITINASFKSQNVMQKHSSIGYLNCEYVGQIKNIYIQNEITEIDESEYQYDVTEKQNGRVMAYLVTNKDDSEYYDLYLQADGIIYPNSDMSYYFYNMDRLDKIENLRGFDTSNVTNMSGMFEHVPAENTNLTLDLSVWDTSKVTDMSYMFSYSNASFIDVSNFDTSKVTDMSYMFQYSSISSIDVSNFDTSNVTNMSFMFSSSSVTVLDISNWNTSNVTNMEQLFADSYVKTLDISRWDTSKVTNMYGTFSYSNIETLDLSDWDFSSVTEMTLMFSGINPLNAILTIRNPNIYLYDNMFGWAATNEGSQIKVNYTLETEKLVDKMIATKSSNSNVVKGNLIVDVDNLAIGDEIHISGEKFNIISQTDDSITMLAQYNLGTDYKQSATINYVKFADSEGWEYTPGPKEIDIQEWSSNPKTYINAYVEYLKAELGDVSVTGDLITLKDLEKLACIVPYNYDYYYVDGEWTCEGSLYGWLANGQRWWTRSATPNWESDVWAVADDELFSDSYNIIDYGIRPVITISKQALRNLN